MATTQLPNGTYSVVCDTCEDEWTAPAHIPTTRQALREARACGWQCGVKDTCPECQKLPNVAAAAVADMLDYSTTIARAAVSTLHFRA